MVNDVNEHPIAVSLFPPVEVKGTILPSPSLFVEPQGAGFCTVEQSSGPGYFLWV